MRILIYGINFSPELTGIGKYTGEMASWLAARGHDVTMVCAMPYYPEWNVHESYKSKFWHKENIAGVRVYRCPLYVPSTASPVKRIIHEFSFVASAFPILLLNLFQRKYDVVLSIFPPFHLGILPLLYAKIRRSKVVTHIQDLQVDAARDLGMINNQPLLRIMFGLEKIFLNSSARISTISDGMQTRIEKKGIPGEKMISFPNWVDTAFIRPLAKSQSLRATFGYAESDRLIMYSGNLGEKQGLETLIDVANEFKGDKSIQFLIVGNGGGKKKLQQLTIDAGLENVRFFPLQAYELLSELLATADIHLVLQRKSASDLVMPSKLVSLLSAGGAAIVTAVRGSSLYNLVLNFKTGIVIDPENAELLVLSIKKALNSDLTIYRQNSRAYAEKHLGKEPIMLEWEKQLQRL